MQPIYIFKIDLLFIRIGRVGQKKVKPKVGQLCDFCENNKDESRMWNNNNINNCALLEKSALHAITPLLPISKSGPITTPISQFVVLTTFA